MLHRHLGRSRLAFVVSAAAISTTQATQPSKPSIYSELPPPPLIHDAPPSALEENIALVRTHVEHVYGATHARLRAAISQWITVEEAVERRIKSFKSPSENITPPILYVLTSTLLGSIIARRSLFLRFTLPPIFFVAASYQFLPQTSRNVSNYVYSLEEKYVPALAKAQTSANKSVHNAAEATKGFWTTSVTSLHSGVQKGVSWTQGVSGLKLQEAWGLTGRSQQTKSQATSPSPTTNTPTKA